MGIKIYHIDELEKFGWVTAIYTTKENSIWKFGKSGAQENLNLLIQSLGIASNSLTMISQAHTDKIKIIYNKDMGEMVTRPQETENCDGMITKEKWIMLFTIEADCVPIYIYDPVSHCIWMVHSGWKGTAKKIAVNAVKLMEEKYGANLSDIHIVLGPHICSSCYEVGWDVKDEFWILFTEEEINDIFTNSHSGKYDLDLGNAIKISLMKVGIQPEHFHDINLCTKETSYFCSRRRDKLEESMLTGVMLNS